MSRWLSVTCLPSVAQMTDNDELRPVEKDLGVVDELAAMRHALGEIRWALKSASSRPEDIQEQIWDIIAPWEQP